MLLLADEVQSGLGRTGKLLACQHEGVVIAEPRQARIKLERDRQTFVYSTLEPSVSAYHLAFGPDQSLYVTGPTTSSYDAVHRIDPHGSSSVFFRGLGRPQGMAFDSAGNLYVAASLSGKRGIARITPDKQASLCVSGQNLVGLCFAPGRAAILATTSSVFHLSWNIQGLPLLP